MPTIGRPRRLVDLRLGVPILAVGLLVCCVGPASALAWSVGDVLGCGEYGCPFPYGQLVPIGIGLCFPTAWILEGLGIGFFARRIARGEDGGVRPAVIWVALVVLVTASGLVCTHFGLSHVVL